MVDMHRVNTSRLFIKKNFPSTFGDDHLLQGMTGDTKWWRIYTRRVVIHRMRCDSFCNELASTTALQI